MIAPVALMSSAAQLISVSPVLVSVIVDVVSQVTAPAPALTSKPTENSC